MTAGPSEVELRQNIDRALAESDRTMARELLRELWKGRPGPLLASFVISRFERLRDSMAPPRFKVAVLRSATLDPVVPVLRAAAFVSGLDLEVSVGDFNAYAQDILTPSSALYRFLPNVAILAVHTPDIAPELWDGFAALSPADVRDVSGRVISTFRSLVREFRAKTPAHLLIHGLEQPQALAHGVLDGQIEPSQTETISTINRALREIAREIAGVYVLDYDALIAREGRAAWYDPRKWMTTHVPLGADCLAALAEEWLRFLHPLAGKTCKALVVDLDNTLWGGVVGEDGLSGIKVGKEYPGAAFQGLQRAILDLRDRGIVLAICSKNNAAEALEALESHPGMLLRPHHFAALRINWDDKAKNLRDIAAELNIGMDALAFIDDNPVERRLVRRLAPEVTVIDLPEDPMGYAHTLRASPVFERLSLSAEDRERGRYYAEERQRSELSSKTESLEDFYRGLQMRVTIALVTADTLARTAQLTQKTNQLNLTTRRYSEQEIAAFAKDPSCGVYTLSASDRFGDNGLVGVAITKIIGDVAELDTLLLSCRVIGRTIETAFLATLAVRAVASGATRLSGKFLRTKKNAPSREIFPSHGFVCTAAGEDESHWELDLASGAPECPPWIDCRFVDPLECPA